MTTQFISLLVIIVVLVIDFIVNGRKKTVDETQKRIEGSEGLKKFNFTEYLLLRKKNVVIFILFTVILKPLIHFTFFADIKEIINNEKKIYLDKSFTPVYSLSGDTLRSYGYLKEGEFYERIKNLNLEDALDESGSNLVVKDEVYEEWVSETAYFGVYTRNKEQINREAIGTRLQTNAWSKQQFEVVVYNYFYYPLETMPLSFNEHLKLMFKSKHWIFLVSFASLGVLVLLFNDKIKAR